MFQSSSQVHRDLQWIVESGMLANGNEPFIMSHQYLDKFSPASVPSVSYVGSRRIGHYFEWLWKQLLDHSGEWKIEMNERQIISNKTTLGEIDLIVSTCSHTVVSIEHWELAVKFYLAFEGRWLGPNPEDSLHDKLDHMQRHQLSLSDSHAFINQYPTLHPDNKQMVIQGRLYVNPFLSSSHVNDTRIATNRVTGAWCWKNQIPDKKAFYLLGRDQWLGLEDIAKLPEIQGQDIRKLPNTVHALDDSGKPWFFVNDFWPFRDHKKATD